jgi:hypothetical protein
MAQRVDVFPMAIETFSLQVQAYLTLKRKGAPELLDEIVRKAIPFFLQRREKIIWDVEISRLRMTHGW